MNPPVVRDCLECGKKDAMKLQNVAGTAPVNIPLLYICDQCGVLLTVPPPPLVFPVSQPAPED
jgi:hypothetical protein